MRPRQNGRHFADDIFKCIFLNENVWIPIEISLKFVPKGPINNIPVLVQIMAWRRSGDKPLSEPIMVSLPTHICVTRPQWVNLIASLHSPMIRSCWYNSNQQYSVLIIIRLVGFKLLDILSFPLDLVTLFAKYITEEYGTCRALYQEMRHSAIVLAVQDYYPQIIMHSGFEPWQHWLKRNFRKLFIFILWMLQNIVNILCEIAPGRCAVLVTILAHISGVCEKLNLN